MSLLTELKKLSSEELGLTYVMMIHNTTQMTMEFSNSNPITSGKKLNEEEDKQFRDKVIFWIIDDERYDDERLFEMIDVSKKRIKELKT